MSLVKWADPHDLTDGPERFTTMPVIPLSALTEVVEGLRFIALTKDQDVVVIAQRLLTQLTAHRKEG